jgi:hypothetical protein
MGLDTSHGAWHGAYSAFMTWREEIAKCIGIPLRLMEGFYPKKDDDFDSPVSLIGYAVKNYPSGATHQWEKLIGYFPLKWEAFKPSPLHELLYHSDCDGDIKWESCNAIADELDKIITELPDQNFGGHVQNIREKTQTFIDGLRLAYKNKENLDFH